MTAIAHFFCRPNSHPFQERHVQLNEPTKIGRSVARCRPSSSNAVFDCKVLSRNHALLWFENGKFYLQDTKSSNGTFVNNQRLSKASEESPAVEVNSCDIVQFGVDVVDNTRKVTHGCVVSQLRLYLPNGEESKQSSCAWNNQLMEKVPFSNVYPTVQAQDLYQLHQYLQEALHREQMLEQKLALLQRLVVNSHDASEKGWQALIDEDRLLSRLEFLENQLQILNKTESEETLHTQLQQIQEDKYNYENTSKETLRQAVQEKLEAVGKLSNLERSLSNTEDECTHLRHLHEQTQNELTNLAASHQVKIQEVQEISAKLQDAERKHADSKTELENEKAEIHKNLEEIKIEEELLKQTLQSLQDEKLHEITASTSNKFQNDTSMQDVGIQVEEHLYNDPPSHNVEEELSDMITSNKMNDKFKEKLQKLLTMQADVIMKDKELQNNEEEIEILKDNLSSAKLDAVDNIDEMEQLGHQLNDCESVLELLLENATKDLKQQLHDANVQIEARKEAAETLKDQLHEMEETINKFESEKLQEQENNKRLEDELTKIQDERERQSAALTETSRELQAALTDRENLIEREKSVRVVVEESEKMLKICQASSSEAEDQDSGDENNITSASFVIFKAKLKELRGKLKESNKQLEIAQEENSLLKEQMSSKPVDANVDVSGDVCKEIVDCDSVSDDKCEDENAIVRIQLDLDEARTRLQQQENEIQQLQNELVQARQTASSVPHLQNELANTQSVLNNREGECAKLQEQLSNAEQTVQAVKIQIVTLQDKLIEEQNAVSKHSLIADELRANCNKQASFIELLQSREQEALDKLCVVLEELAQKQDQVASLEEELRDCFKEKDAVATDFDALTQSLFEAQREKMAVNEELVKLEEEKFKNQASLQEQIECNKSLQESASEQKEKWQHVIGNKDEELAQVTTRCQQLIQEREANLRKMQKSSSARKLAVMAIMVAVISFFYYIVFADQVPQRPI